MYTANIVDTGLFRALGKPPNDAYDAVRAAVRRTEATLVIPSTIYAELGDSPDPEAVPSGSDYVDTAIRDGWVRVADPVPGEFQATNTTREDPVVKARRDTHDVIARLTNHPKTANEWADTAIIGLAVRLFEQNERIRITIHTTDRAVANAAQVVIPLYGYYDLRAEYYPPKTVKEMFPNATNFTW